MFHIQSAVTNNFGSTPLGLVRAEGIIRNVNTLEDFKNMDKAAMLKTAGRQVCGMTNDNTMGCSSQ